MVPPKFYCPYCGLELSGDGHKNDSQAWFLFNCEYNRLRDEKPAIPEMQVQKQRIVELMAEKDKLELTIQATVDRIAQLETGCAEVAADAAFSEEEIHLCRQWFDTMQDVLHPQRLQVNDYALAAKLYRRCGMRIPHSITSKLSKGQSHEHE